MRRWIWGLFILCGAGCSGVPASMDAGPTKPSLFVNLGRVNEGGGGSGLALLLQLERSVVGPGELTAALLDSEGVTVATFMVPDAASAQAAWWPAIRYEPGASWTVEVRGSGQPHSVTALARNATGLDLAEPVLGAQAEHIEWAQVPGAAAHRCQLDGAALTALSNTTGCALASLTPGAHEAVIQSFSLDPTAADPFDPSRSFDVSLARLAFTSGPQPVQLRASLGAIRYGSSGDGLALFAALTRPDGSASTSQWQLSLSGPGLPSSSPLKFTLEGPQRRTVAWSYEHQPRAGSWSLRASSPEGTLAVSLSASVPSPLPEPAQVVARPKGNGGLEVSWAAVAGARAYFVSVWSKGTGTFLKGQWVSSPSASFPNQSFASGTEGQVFIAATNADVLGTSAAPAALAVSENSYSPTPFVTP